MVIGERQDEYTDAGKSIYDLMDLPVAKIAMAERERETVIQSGM